MNEAPARRKQEMRKSQQPQQHQQQIKSSVCSGSTPSKARRSPRDPPSSDAAAPAAIQEPSTSVDSRRVSQVLLAGDDEDYQDVLNKLKADALVPMVEDLSDWLNTVLGMSVWQQPQPHRQRIK
jgi:hypothetical protein